MMQREIHTATESIPIVSVAMTAFNSEKWIARAIESVLMQQTVFPIEIIVADDCSTDRTVAVAQRFCERYPKTVRVLARTQNIGIQRNYYETFEMCRGKYIAWLDSDDFWTDPSKLQIQVDALENDLSIAVCGHFVRWVTADNDVKRDFPRLAPGRYGISEMIRGNFLPSPSVMFRNGVQRDLPQWYFDLAPITDWPIWILAARSGDILMIDRVMADYQLTPNSSFTGQSQLKCTTADVRFYEQVESILPAEFHRIARSEKGKRYETLAYLLRKQGEFDASLEAAVKAFSSPFLQDNCGSKAKSLIASLVRKVEWSIRK
jgi:glycosyltransferase involved in cell wall biosynthesis